MLLDMARGLRASTACLAVQYINDFSVGNVGCINDPCEAKLVDIPEKRLPQRSK